MKNLRETIGGIKEYLRRKVDFANLIAVVIVEWIFTGVALLALPDITAVLSIAVMLIVTWGVLSWLDK